jgi:hypothetical protein
MEPFSVFCQVLRLRCVYDIPSTRLHHPTIDSAQCVSCSSALAVRAVRSHASTPHARFCERAPLADAVLVRLETERDKEREIEFDPPPISLSPILLLADSGFGFQTLAHTVPMFSMGPRLASFYDLSVAGTARHGPSVHGLRKCPYKH